MTYTETDNQKTTEVSFSNLTITWQGGEDRDVHVERIGNSQER